MAGPLEIINERGLESLGRYYSIYRGVVVDNKDPEHLGRVKITVPQFDNVVAEWAYPLGQEGSIQTGFKYLTPKIGQIVFVQFECGDPLYPLWSYCGWAEEEIPEEFKDPHTFGIITPSSHKVLVKDKDGIIYISISDESEKEVTSFILDRDSVSIKAKEIRMMGADQGITLTDQLVKRLNNLEKQLNSLKIGLTSALTSAVPTDGGKAAFSSLQPWANEKVILTSMDDIENKKIFQ